MGQAADSVDPANEPPVDRPPHRSQFAGDEPKSPIVPTMHVADPLPDEECESGDMSENVDDEQKGDAIHAPFCHPPRPHGGAFLSSKCENVVRKRGD